MPPMYYVHTKRVFLVYALERLPSIIPALSEVAKGKWAKGPESILSSGIINTAPAQYR
jgi:hypothetical protein